MSANTDINVDITPVEVDTCICGNTSSGEGMMACNSSGAIACLCGDDRHAKSTNSTLVELPDSLFATYTLCPSCGRVYSDYAYAKGDHSPAFTIDLNHPWHALNLGDYYDEADGQ